MYDIEVIDGSNYAVISEGSPAYEFLKAMNTKLVMKKLASEPGEEIFLTDKEVIPLCRGFRINDLKRLQTIGLIKYEQKWYWDHPVLGVAKEETYTFTTYGLDVMGFIKEHGGDVEIQLN